MIKFKPVLLAGCCTIVLSQNACKTKHTGNNEQKPNVLLILADDLGYSDLGCFGSEIPTPNLDKLAREGVRMTQFYNSAKCCPTRASLLTGLHPHQVGMGDMVEGRLLPDSTELPAYQGFLNNSCMTIAEVLKENGYHTMLSGKWHVGNEQEHWPHERGFTDNYTLINGMSNYFNLDPWLKEDQFILLLDGNDTVTPGEGFYMTNAITGKAVEFLDKRPGEKPFFMYLAYTAPHFPLQALEEDIEKFRGTYLAGWDTIRQRRYEKMKSMGIISAENELPPPYQQNELTPDWESLSRQEKDEFDARMATHAAMIYRMDAGIGQVIDKLEKEGELENTIILFLSDNGASKAAFYLVDELIADRSGKIGSEKSFESQGPCWANVSNAPLSLFKKYTGEGGICTGLIAYWPGHFAPGVIENHPGHVMDIMPTLLDATASKYPDKFRGNSILPLEGQSLLSLLMNKEIPEERPICIEHMGNKSVRLGEWKLVYINNHHINPGSEWQLYHLTADRGEQHDLSGKYPGKAEELKAIYQAWATHVGVYEPYDSLILARPI